MEVGKKKSSRLQEEECVYAVTVVNRVQFSRLLLPIFIVSFRHLRPSIIINITSQLSSDATYNLIYVYLHWSFFNLKAEVNVKGLWGLA